VLGGQEEDEAAVDLADPAQVLRLDTRAEVRHRFDVALLHVDHPPQLRGEEAEADRLRTVLDEADSLAKGFMATAEVIRHLLLDPYLPEELLPMGWPEPESAIPRTQVSGALRQGGVEQAVGRPIGACPKPGRSTRLSP